MSRNLTRRNALLMFAAVPAAGLVLSACSDSQPTAATQANAAPSRGTVDVAKLMAEGALPDKALGSEDAPVTIVEYASMTCGHCAAFHNNTLPAIKEKYIDTGKVRLIVREFPFDPRAEAGFMLARCSEDRYHAMIDVLFRQQSNWATVENARAALLQISRLAGFSQEAFEACLTNQQLLDDVRAVRTRGANEFGVDSTPTFFINGTKYTGNMSVDEMSGIIDALL